MGFQCDGCGRATNHPLAHQRPNGDQHWLCASCQPRAYGSVPVDVAEQVRRDREAYAGGPKVLREPAAAK